MYRIYYSYNTCTEFIIVIIHVQNLLYVYRIYYSYNTCTEYITVIIHVQNVLQL